MALADIISKIASDAESEASEIVGSAEESAARLVADARAEASRLSEARIARGERDAEAEAATVRANARLNARDAALGAKRELIDSVLAGVVDAIVALPDEQYASFLGRSIATAARGGETVRIAAADASRLSAALPAAVAATAPALRLEFSSEPASGIEHGVMLAADRSHEDFSIATIVAERKEDLSMLASRILYDAGEA